MLQSAGILPPTFRHYPGFYPSDSGGIVLGLEPGAAPKRVVELMERAAVADEAE